MRINRLDLQGGWAWRSRGDRPSGERRRLLQILQIPVTESTIVTAAVVTIKDPEGYLGSGVFAQDQRKPEEFIGRGVCDSGWTTLRPVVRP